jgi:hypothetical protein
VAALLQGRKIEEPQVDCFLHFEDIPTGDEYVGSVGLDETDAPRTLWVGMAIAEKGN